MIALLSWDYRNACLVQSQIYGDNAIVVDSNIVNFDSDMFSGMCSY